MAPMDPMDWESPAPHEREGADDGLERVIDADRVAWDQDSDEWL